MVARIFGGALSVAFCTVAVAESSEGLWFTDSTKAAGIVNTGATAGVSWGDINGDDWPDVWIGGHMTTAPTLLINQRNGTFRDEAGRLGIADDADLHGGAFADYDGDGDQDLFVLVGGDSGTRPNPNVLLQNDDGVLRNVAAAAGLDYPYGRGRTPIWVDANGDGRLDVLVTNKQRADEQSTTTLFIQQQPPVPDGVSTSKFSPLAPPLVVPPAARSWLDDMVYRAWHGFSMRRRDFGSLLPEEPLAQLIDVNADQRLELLIYGATSRIYRFDALDDSAVQDISDDIYLGTERGISDVAIDDFDGNLQSDLYLARVSSGSSYISQPSPRLLRAAFRGSTKVEPTRLQFVTQGKITLQVVDAWELSTRLPPVFVGGQRKQPDGIEFELDPADASVIGPVKHTPNTHEVLIDYDPQQSRWTISNWLRPANVVVTSATTISDVKAVGYETRNSYLKDRLLLQQDGEFATADVGVSSGCGGVASGDFDNDMDVDLYLVCANPVENVPNLLLENRGNGEFVAVVDAGGAAGSDQGRADSVATADYNRDGFLDLFVTNGRGAPPFVEGGPYQLFTNVPNDNHWIQLQLVGTQSNRDGIGAVVHAQAGGVTQVREHNNGMHAFSQNFARIHFGLGANEKVDLKIWWPSGQVQILSDQTSNQILTVVEPEASR